ncbi:MAG: Kelch repeat-containing protein [Planctomycetota bacterium]
MSLITVRFAVVPLALLFAVPLAAQWSTALLSVARQGHSAVTVGDLALFAGGRLGQTTSSIVDIYDRTNGTWSTTSLSVPRSDLAATTIGPYAMFAGGVIDAATESAVVDVFDSRTRTWSTASLSQARFQLAATTLGNKAIFAGGAFGGIGTGSALASAVVDIYDAALGAPGDPNAWSTTVLSRARGGLAAESAGGQAVFAGGFDGTAALATVDIYDDASGTWSTAALSQARLLTESAAASMGTRICFVGGQTDATTMSPMIEVYDTSNGTWSTSMMSIARLRPGVTVVGSYVIIAGGTMNGFLTTDVVDTFDPISGTFGASQQLSIARGDFVGVTVGGRALFAGGRTGGATAVRRVDILDQPSLEVVRLGSPTNPDALRPGTTSGPTLGATWDPRIDHASFLPGALLDVLLVGFTPDNLPSPFGTILCDTNGAIALTGPSGSPFAVSIPLDEQLLGVTLSVQGVSIDASNVALANALDITLGSR